MLDPGKVVEVSLGEAKRDPMDITHTFDDLRPISRKQSWRRGGGGRDQLSSTRRNDDEGEMEDGPGSVADNETEYGSKD